MVVVIRQQRWRFAGLSFGPPVPCEVRISYHPENGFRDERLDGRPLYDLQPSASQQLKAAHIELMREFRRCRETTSHGFRRSAAQQPAAELVRAVARQKAQTALRLVALRDERWRAAQHAPAQQSDGDAGQDDLPPSQEPADVVTPFAEGAPVDAGGDATAPQRTTSVFRCDRNETTARIARLRQAKPVVPGVAVPAEPVPESTLPGQYRALGRQSPAAESKLSSA
jgi:hypothetical protein